MGYPTIAHMKIKKNQLELGLRNQRPCPSKVRRSRRLHRASLWFNRMRQVVDSAMDHHPAPAPRSEQIWFLQS
jgi:hypothetical protein